MMKFSGKRGKICIVGIGNTLRNDDGAGAYLCSLIEIINLPEVTTLTVQQLNTELIEELLIYDCIILADASINGGEVQFYRLQEQQHPTDAVSSSHYTSVQMLNKISQKLYGRELPLFICTIRGENFNIGETLSDRAINNINTASMILSDWINKNY